MHAWSRHRHWASADHGAGLIPDLAACRLARRAPPGLPHAGTHPFLTSCGWPGAPPLGSLRDATAANHLRRDPSKQKH
eukprot:8180027-Heterocapsa_arctica.AAC.1